MNNKDSIEHVSIEEYNKTLKELEELRNKVAFLETVLDEIPIPTFVKNDDAKFCLLNKAYEKYFDVKRDGILDTSVLNANYLAKDDRKRYQEEDVNAIIHSTEVHYETSFIIKGSSTSAMYWSKGFLTKETNQRGLVGVVVDITKQKKYEVSLSNSLEELSITKERLKYSDEHMKVFFNAVPFPAQIWSEDYTILDSNIHTAKIFGFETHQEFVDNFFDLHPEYQPNGEKSHELGPKYIDEAFEKGFLRKEWVNNNIHGESIPFDITFIRSSLDGKPVLLVFLKDLREHYDNMRKLHEADTYTQLMLDASPFGTAIWNKDFQLVHCNKAMAVAHGLQNTEGFVASFHTLYPKYQPNGSLSITFLEQQLHNTLKHGSSKFYWIGKCTNNESLPAEVSLIRVKNRGEYMMIAYHKDLRDVEDNIKKARIAEKRIETILDGVPLGINLMNSNIEIIDCNEEAIRMSGYSSKQEYIERVLNFIPEYQPNGQETKVFLQEKFSEVVQNGQARFELLCYDANGHDHHTDVTFTQAHVESETMYIAYVHDLRETKKMLAEVELSKNIAERSTAAKSEFLANMSHEIRTPMNGILGLLHILSATQLDAVQQNYLENVLFSTNELVRIINDILDFSKIESGKLEMELTAFTIHEICSEVESLLGNVIQGKNLVFNLDEGTYPTTVIIGDPLRLKQVLLNLLSNSIKFTESGSISLKIRSNIQNNDALHCHFSIKDTGIGLSKEQMSGLFTAFTQADSSVTRKYGGTGLGLAIAKNIVNMMQGDIWVESDLGKGSSFFFTAIFKLASVGVETATQAKHIYDQAQHTHSGHLLLVEDNEINQIIAKEMLTSVGYTLDIAHNGQEALTMLKSIQYDLVLMDIQMPIMDGLSTSKAIRKNPKFSTLPIIAMSAHAMVGDKEKSLKSGMNDHITKPINPTVLYETLLYWLNNKGS